MEEDVCTEESALHNIQLHMGRSHDLKYNCVVNISLVLWTKVSLFSPCVTETGVQALPVELYFAGRLLSPVFLAWCRCLETPHKTARGLASPHEADTESSLGPDKGGLELLIRLHKALQGLTKLPQQACYA